jgi:hypothetical protein
MKGCSLTGCNGNGPVLHAPNSPTFITWRDANIVLYKVCTILRKRNFPTNTGHATKTVFTYLRRYNTCSSSKQYTVHSLHGYEQLSFRLPDWTEASLCIKSILWMLVVAHMVNFPQNLRLPFSYTNLRHRPYNPGFTERNSNFLSSRNTLHSDRKLNIFMKTL